MTKSLGLSPVLGNSSEGSDSIEEDETGITCEDELGVVIDWSGFSGVFSLIGMIVFIKLYPPVDSCNY